MNNKKLIKTILIVDDDAEWREFIGNALAEEYPVERCFQSIIEVYDVIRAGKSTKT